MVNVPVWKMKGIIGDLGKHTIKGTYFNWFYPRWL